MPLTKLIDSLNGVCGQKPGIFQRHHPRCEQASQEGWQQWNRPSRRASSRPSPKRWPTASSAAKGANCNEDCEFAKLTAPAVDLTSNQYLKSKVQPTSA